MPSGRVPTSSSFPLHKLTLLLLLFRLVSQITMDPMSRFAALADNLGRVILLDVPRRQMLRMWKGYREAQCAWIWAEPPQTSSRTGSPRGSSPRSSLTTSGSRSSSTPKPVESCTSSFISNLPLLPGLIVLDSQAMPLYLVIYAPRRGILEVWHTRHGGRVGIMDVGVDGYGLSLGSFVAPLSYVACFARRLLATTCPLGSNMAADSAGTQRVPFPPRCFFLSPSGRLLEITLRFHTP